MVEVKGTFEGKGKKIALVVSRFNESISEALLRGAIDTLTSNNVSKSDLFIYHVPGAFEIPLVVKKIATKKAVDGIIVLGAVIRGATPHFDYVSNFATQGSAQIGVDFSIPVLNGILTVDTIEQAVERSGTKSGNKGRDCSFAVSEMINLLKKI